MRSGEYARFMYLCRHGIHSDRQRPAHGGDPRRKPRGFRRDVRPLLRAADGLRPSLPEGKLGAGHRAGRFRKRLDSARDARSPAVALRLPAAFGLQPVGQLRQQAPPCVQLPLLLPGTYRKHRLRLLRSRPESGHRKALLAGSAHEYQRGDRSPPGQMPRGLFAELPARILPPRDQRTDGDCAEHGRKPYLPCPEATAGKIVEIGADSAAVFHFFAKFFPAACLAPFSALQAAGFCAVFPAYCYAIWPSSTSAAFATASSIFSGFFPPACAMFGRPPPPPPTMAATALIRFPA